MISSNKAIAKKAIKKIHNLIDTVSDLQGLRDDDPKRLYTKDKCKKDLMYIAKVGTLQELMEDIQVWTDLYTIDLEEV